MDERMDNPESKCAQYASQWRAEQIADTGGQGGMQLAARDRIWGRRGDRTCCEEGVQLVAFAAERIVCALWTADNGAVG